MQPTARRYKWHWTVALALIVMLVALYLLLPPAAPGWTTVAVKLLFVACVVALGIGAIREQVLLRERLERHNDELYALYEAGLEIHGDLDLGQLLERIVEQARELMDARYGALSVVDDEGTIVEFITSGIEPELAEQIGAPPTGRGLLAVPLLRGERLRLDDLARDPRSAGFPAKHPPMKSLLAVPIASRNGFRGNLYLAEKETAPAFTQFDEESLVRFARIAGLAVDTSSHHEQLRSAAVSNEALRIAREMHDGLAQVLASVSVRSQAALRLLRKNDTDAVLGHLEGLGESARTAYDEVRESILALRNPLNSELDLEEAVDAYAQDWSEQTGIVTAVSSQAVQLPWTSKWELYRVLQEALSNVRRHAAAGRVEIRMAANGEGTTLSVSDDGTGFEVETAAEGNGYGLSIMRERVEGIGGTLTLTTAPGEGTKILAEVPRRQGTDP